MKRILHLILLLLLFPLFPDVPGQIYARKKTEKFILVIDPGHGGNDLGATGRRSHEKDLTLKIAKRAAKLIRRHTRNTIVILTREKDEYISLEERADMANFFQADLFLSVHINSARTLAQGTESFVHRKNRNSWTEYFAQLLQLEYTYYAKRKSRGVKRANFSVLRETNMPAVLTEVGFISHAQEEKYMKSRRGYKKLASCIYRAFKQYKETYDEALKH